MVRPPPGSSAPCVPAEEDGEDEEDEEDEPADDELGAAADAEPEDMGAELADRPVPPVVEPASGDDTV